MNRIALGLLVSCGMLVASAACCEAANPHAGTQYRHAPHGVGAYHGQPHRRPPVPHYQKHAPHWRFNGYYPKYEAGFHARHLQDIGFPGGGIWWRGRPW